MLILPTPRHALSSANTSAHRAGPSGARMPTSTLKNCQPYRANLVVVLGRRQGRRPSSGHSGASSERRAPPGDGVLPQELQVNPPQH
eukprot:CAMPEP_0183352316 /NCGR_PEP_ID=MMETSP0164_2-20130417/29174_1 /TAXON_ID=221442 /ORGANISM="Coccolithus pelagicus ssp braarudi, Strain PLY182g" /LENGTH=86 /DNA_ID=CAMNT_0025524715 /DNA_START=149 /DNA_END=407 /DNA_ORIENTATION=+